VKKMTPVPFTDAHWNKARGTCTLCGTEVSSATSLYCWVCYKKCLKPCPECITERGALAHKYQKHGGTPPKILCARCGVNHQDDRQLVCPTCNNDRNVFVPPEKEGQKL
jgi:hypothetical protein